MLDLQSLVVLNMVQVSLTNNDDDSSDKEKPPKKSDERLSRNALVELACSLPVSVRVQYVCLLTDTLADLPPPAAGRIAADGARWRRVQTIYVSSRVATSLSNSLILLSLSATA